MKTLYPNLEEIRQQARCSTGPGWWPIIDRLLADIAESEPSAAGIDPINVEIKEKYGELRIYILHDSFQNPGHVEELIRSAENESSRTCEECGRPGTLHTVHGWDTTLCEECASKKV